MKKILLFTLASAIMLFAESCHKDNGVKDGDASEVTFCIDLPIDLSTKTIADGTTATELYYGVFNKDGEYIQSLAQTDVVPVVGKTATLKLKLVRNYTYSIVFWAQAPGAPYTFTPETGVVTVDYSGDANDESRDAFCKLHTFTVPDKATFDETVVLTRPFAQINFGAADFDQVTELGIDMESTIEIKGLADTYNMLNGTISGPADSQLELSTVPAQCDPVQTLVVNRQTYGYVSMNYILAPENATEITNVNATFAYNGETVELDVPNVPIQRNYRTNIVGTFFTDEVTFTIIVDEEFNQPDYVCYATDSFAQAYDKAKDGDIIILTQDLEETAVIDGKKVTVDLNGKTLTGALFAESNGTMNPGNTDSYGFWVKNGGELTIKGNGTIKTQGCKYSIAVWAQGGSVIIEDGWFENAGEGSDLVYASADGHVTIMDGEFKACERQVGVEGTQEKYSALNLKGDGTGSTITVYGGRYYMFNPSDNLSENPKVDFVAAGKTVEKDGDWYVVK